MSHRVLVVGVGSIGERHLRCFSQTRRAVMSICEPSELLRERMIRSYSVEQCSADLEVFLADPPDVAVICTPAQMHVQMATRLAQAGVHLLIEKPLGISDVGVDELVWLVKQKQLTAAVAYVLRTNPSLAEMREAIHSGRFGDPLQLVFTSGQNFPFFRPAYHQIYYASRATGGGAIQDALTHGINAAEWLVGPVTEVAADANHQLLAGVEVEDTVHVIARHGAVMASYSLNQYQAPNETTLTVVCQAGTVRCRLHQQRWFWQVSPEADWTEGGYHPVERDEMFIAQANRFLDAVQQRSNPLCTLAEGLQTLRVNLAVLRAADQRSWQTIDSKSA